LSVNQTHFFFVGIWL